MKNEWIPVKRHTREYWKQAPVGKTVTDSNLVKQICAEHNISPEFGLFVLALNNTEQVNVLPISTTSKVCPLYI